MHKRLGSLVPPPLYDPSTEHDACGVGFVADTGGRSHGRVLGLALAGLGSLGHRGAFAADGLSSDGAGIALPLEAALVDHLTASFRPGVRAGIGHGPAVLQLFLPCGRTRQARARRVVEGALAEVGLLPAAWRRVPADTSALGPLAFASRPAFWQVFVARPSGARADRPLADGAFERRLLLVRRRIAAEAARAGLDDLSVASGSSRTIVYKGLVAGGRLAQLYPDLAAPVPISFATFHQRYATNTHPTWRLAQPFGRLAHNGEINTVRGNREELRGRRGDPDPAGLIADLEERGPLLSVGGSDSASLDEAVELLVASGWDLPGALAMLIPAAPALRAEASPGAAALARRTTGFLAPWDGPAALVFTDGRSVGALLDRNGLRPLAYAITTTGLVTAASEAGAVPLAPSEIQTLARLGPGEMLLIEPRRGRIHVDAAARQRVSRAIISHDPPRPAFDDRLPRSLEALGSPALSTGARYLAALDAERLRLDVRTLAIDAHEPLWSMGDDTPTPGHGRVQRRAADHLKQAFAQVTNPPIDPERERLVVDLRVHVGRRAPLLGGRPGRARSARLARPMVADLPGLLATMRRLRGGVVSLDSTWPAAAGREGLEAALERLAVDAVAAARRGAIAVVLTDRRLDLDRLPVPSVLAAGAVHATLTEAGLRGRTDIVVDAADLLDVHSLAMAIAAGARAAHPWLAIRLAAEAAGSRGAEEIDVERAVGNLLDGLEAGLRKTLARMGISAVASYVGGAFFETLDLAPEVTSRCFPAALRWEGAVGFAELADGQLARRDAALGLDAGVAAPVAAPVREARLPDPGFARFRADGELHLYAPRIVAAVQALAAGPSTEASLSAYRATLARDDPAVIRDRFEVRPAVRRRAISLEEVEPARAIVRRLVVSAMSVGALSPEAHQVLTIGIQRAGGVANTGEGGEDPAWYVPGPGGERRDAAIKQVASGRFGVTATYLARAEQLEIKIAQGSKPGEGGQLPARKATAYIAGLRRGQAGQAYISPPPHHDIYSIEDLAQLIHDLKNANSQARVHVKLVAEAGIGTVAAGVAKAHADVVLVSGHDGGTGAAALTALKHAGMPWEIGLADTQQTLILNGLRDRITVQVDGAMKTGRDVVVAALLGAEEFGFATAPLIVSGCVMMRVCHLDTCPVGVATQNPLLRERFTGKPEFVVTFFEYIAEQVREILAELGLRSLEDAVGQVELLETATAIETYKGAGLDLTPLFTRPDVPGNDAVKRTRDQDHGLDAALDNTLIQLCEGALLDATPVSLELPVRNVNRTVGTMLGSLVTRRFGEQGLPDGTINLTFTGSAGQSFGAFVPRGLTLRLFGDANDYVGKGLCGGLIVIRPAEAAPFAAQDNVIAGNVIGYGATSGAIFLRGLVGERFCVRNSGVTAVVEGVGDHALEYMTGGTVVILGPTGRNLAAGMSGGHAYVLDLDPALVNPELVDVAAVPHPERAALLGLVQRHHEETGSAVAAALLADWAAALPRFSAVVARDYARVLEATRLARAEGRDVDEAVMAAAQR